MMVTVILPDRTNFSDELKDGVDYLIGSDISNLKAEEEEDAPTASTSAAAANDDDDDIVEISPANVAPSAPKRRMDEAAPESGDGEIAAKKRKVAEEKVAASEDVVCID